MVSHIRDRYDCRLDRNSNTHPPCPNNTKKFRKNGGGVLIAVSNNMDMTPKLVKIDTRAEILSITLKFKGNKKICITTCYRVGTLSDTNYEEITKHIEQISGNKNINRCTGVPKIVYMVTSQGVKSIYFPLL